MRARCVGEINDCALALFYEIPIDVSLIPRRDERVEVEECGGVQYRSVLHRYSRESAGAKLWWLLRLFFVFRSTGFLTRLPEIFTVKRPEFGAPHERRSHDAPPTRP